MLTKKRKLKRKITISSAKVEAWRVFSKYIRLRDCFYTTGSFEWGECISCDNPAKHISELDAGHFIPKKNANYFSEKGVNAQCRSCNRFKSGSQLGYIRGLVEKYGEGIVGELEDEARPIKKFTVAELRKIKIDYQQKIEELGV